MKTFQTVSLGAFILLGIIGTLMFAGIIPSPGSNGARGEKVTLEMWGTLDARVINEAIRNLNVGNDVILRYIKKEESDLEIDLLRSITSGTQPDLILFPHDILLSLEDNLFVITDYPSFDERDFRNTYIEGAEIFVKNGEILALPVLADPLVMYWNRDIFNDKRITQTPENWSNVIDFATSVTELDQRGKILKSAIALGEADNINHFKEVVSLLLIQAGDEIIKRANDGRPAVVLGDTPAGVGGPIPAHSALSFYAGFSDPTKRHYSWNTSLDTAFNSFAQGSLAVYIAPASQYNTIKNRNPLLNYDVAPVPQLEEGTDMNFGRIYGIGIVKNSLKFNQAFTTAFLLAFSDEENQRILSNTAFLPPVRRKILSGGVTDPVMSVFYDGSVIVSTWLDPDPVATENIFRKMVRDVSTNISTVSEAVFSASTKLENLVR